MIEPTYPLERYLHVRTAYQPSFSPDGRRLAFLTDITGLPQVWIVDAAGGWPEQLTFGTDRVSAVAFSPADDWLLFSRDAGGNENTQLFLLRADGTEERRLTHDDGAMHIFGGWSADGQRVAFAANRRHRGRYDVYVQDVAADEAQLVWQNDQPGIVIPAGFAPDGTRLLVLFMHSMTDEDLYEIDLASGQVRHLTPQPGHVRYDYPAYAADGQAVYCLSDLDREHTAVVRLDLADLHPAVVAAPAADVDLLAVAPDGSYLVWASNYDGAHHLTSFDLPTGSQRDLDTLPVGVVNPLDLSVPVFAPDRPHLAFSFASPTRTVDVWMWDLAQNTAQPVTRSSHAGIATASFVEPMVIHYPTFDGREIPAWWFPPRPTAAAAPVVVYVHGGPEAQTRPLFYPTLQYLMACGYAVLAPNVRGSTGYGKTYTHLDDVEKRMDSVADLAYAAHWLRQQPGIDARRIAVFGGSYGGFMVLAALTAYPDLWAAGVDIVGIGNFVTFLENTSAYRRSTREAEYGSLAHDREFLARISPIHHVDRIRVPLMVVHGANDPRVPLNEAEQIVAALRQRDVPVEFLVYPDEGHGLVKLTNRLDAYPKMAGFLARHV